MAAALLFEGFNQECLPLRVERSHTPYVTTEVPFLYKVCQDRLLNRGRVTPSHRARRKKSVNERGRRDDVAQPQRREEKLAERPDVDDPTVAVETLKRRDGATFVPVLAVEVVLHHPRPGAARPL